MCHKDIQNPNPPLSNQPDRGRGQARLGKAGDKKSLNQDTNSLYPEWKMAQYNTSAARNGWKSKVIKSRLQTVYIQMAEWKVAQYDTTAFFLICVSEWAELSLCLCFFLSFCLLSFSFVRSHPQRVGVACVENVRVFTGLYRLQQVCHQGLRYIVSFTIDWFNFI